MLNKEITTILNEHNNEDGISHVIAESLIRYYSVNGFNAEDFKNKYLNYLRTIFLDRQFPFLDTVKLLSYKDQILTGALAIIHDDITDKIKPEEAYQSCQWQPEVLESILTVLFDNEQLLAIIGH